MNDDQGHGKKRVKQHKKLKTVDRKMKPTDIHKRAKLIPRRQAR